jgi:hypothetical protein
MRYRLCVDDLHSFVIDSDLSISDLIARGWYVNYHRAVNMKLVRFIEKIE